MARVAGKVPREIREIRSLRSLMWLERYRLERARGGQGDVGLSPG